MTLAIGDPALAFALSAGDGATVTLSGFRGRPVVLYFYPKDDTPGCTKEACSFRDELPAFTTLGAVVLGVSADDAASHRAFTDKFRLTFPLLSDPESKTAKAYGVYKQKSMYGRTYWGIERTTFVINGRGNIARIFPKVKVDGHTADVLSAVQDLVSRRAAANLVE